MIKFIFQNHSRTNNAILLNAAFLMLLLVSGIANPMAIVFAYVFETFVIGPIHAIKLFYIIRYNNQPGKLEKNWVNYVTIIFFIIHYSFFAAIQSLFIYIAFAIHDNRFSTSLSLNNFKVILNLEGFYIVAVSIILTNLAEFYFNFIKNKKYNNQNFETYFAKPYLRIFIQQIVAIIPFMFLLLTKSVGIIAALLLITIRTLLDLYINKTANNFNRTNKIAQFLSQNKSA